MTRAAPASDRPIFYNETGLRWRLFLFISLVVLVVVGATGWVFSTRILANGPVDRVFDFDRTMMADHLAANSRKEAVAELTAQASEEPAMGGPLLPAVAGTAVPLPLTPSALPEAVRGALEPVGPETLRRRPARALGLGADGSGARRIHALWPEATQAGLATATAEATHIDVLHPGWLRLDDPAQPLHLALGAEARATRDQLLRHALLLQLALRGHGRTILPHFDDAAGRQDVACRVAFD
ncbi:MAG: hypothetical protein ACO1OK_05380, partial [Devosia sp.]